MRTQKKYRRQFALWMGLYALMFIPMIFLSAVTATLSSGKALRFFFILLPLIPLFLALRAFICDINTFDEMQQRIHLEAFAFSLGCMCVLTSGYGMLEVFIGLPHISLVFVLPMTIICWLIGAILARRKYQ